MRNKEFELPVTQKKRERKKGRKANDNLNMCINGKLLLQFIKKI